MSYIILQSGFVIRRLGVRVPWAALKHVDRGSSLVVRKQKSVHRLDLAREWAQTVKADALRGEIRGKKKLEPIPFGTFADEYLKVWGLKRKPSTVEREKTRIDGILKPYFGQKPIQTISRKDIDLYIAKRLSGEFRIRLSGGISKATANRELCRLKNMLQKAVEWGYLPSNPAEGVKQEPEKVEEADFLSSSQPVGGL